MKASVRQLIHWTTEHFKIQYGPVCTDGRTEGMSGLLKIAWLRAWLRASPWSQQCTDPCVELVVILIC